MSLMQVFLKIVFTVSLQINNQRLIKIKRLPDKAAFFISDIQKIRVYFE
ncbi:MAG: hypothetical protein UZ10_BCD003000067 [Bacteroidetes bacterium OLB10]|nr:MAG: hypothetical protein UZ10_BCD003000067 [Bacteroidetes bacterium OLB10]